MRTDVRKGEEERVGEEGVDPPEANLNSDHVEFKKRCYSFTPQWVLHLIMDN